MFTYFERSFLQSLAKDFDFTAFIPQDEIAFLREKKRFHQIQQKVFLFFFDNLY